MTGIALTLPTFSADPEPLVAAARAADAAGLDAVFTFDHLYRIGSEGEEPALALEPVLGALAVETKRVRFGPLVARATIRKPAALQTVLDTVQRIAPGRLIAGVGSGDVLSDGENEAFGVPAGSVAVRLGALEATVEALRGRGYPVWVGGRSARVLGTAAALADGWNAWNVSPAAFTSGIERLREACTAAQRPEGEVEATWGGLVELRSDRWIEAAARPDIIAGPYERMAERLHEYVAAGASWIVVAPLAPGHPDNAAIVTEELAPRLR